MDQENIFLIFDFYQAAAVAAFHLAGAERGR
jgi:hypothetical protein